MSPPGVASPVGGECAPGWAPAPQSRAHLAAHANAHASFHVIWLCICHAPPCQLPRLSHPRLPPATHPAGPSSPRAAWPNTRGTSADAFANAVSKGSPRGVTPTSSNAALSAAPAAGVPAVAAASKLKKLQTLPPFLSPAPSASIPNQGEQAAVGGEACRAPMLLPRCLPMAGSFPFGDLALFQLPSLPLPVPPPLPAGLQRVDTSGHLMSPSSMKRRGLQVGPPSQPASQPLPLASLLPRLGACAAPRCKGAQGYACRHLSSLDFTTLVPAPDLPSTRPGCIAFLYIPLNGPRPTNTTNTNTHTTHPAFHRPPPSTRPRSTTCCTRAARGPTPTEWCWGRCALPLPPPLLLLLARANRAAMWAGQAPIQHMRQYGRWLGGVTRSLVTAPAPRLPPPPWPQVRQRLVATRKRMEELLAGHVPDSDAGGRGAGGRRWSRTGLLSSCCPVCAV